MHRLACYEVATEGVRIMPGSNVGFAADQTEALREHDKLHRAPDGVGWTQPYRLDDPPQTLAALAIPAEHFRALLAPHARAYDSVTVTGEFGYGFSGDDELSYIGFGPSAKAGVVAECSKDRVTAIWCLLPGATPEENAVLAEMLLALDDKHDLILVDWRVGAIVPLNIREHVEWYLADLLEICSSPAASPAPPAGPPPPGSRRPPPRSAAGAGPAGLSARLRRFLLRRWRAPWAR
jgi:hypothetical protein